MGAPIKLRLTCGTTFRDLNLGLGDVLKVERLEPSTGGNYFYASRHPRKGSSQVWICTQGTALAQDLVCVGSSYRITKTDENASAGEAGYFEVEPLESASFSETCLGPTFKLTQCSCPGCTIRLPEGHTLCASHQENKEFFQKASSIMYGAVYTGVVVKTKTVAAGAGVTTGVQVSEVVFHSDEPFVAISDDAAKAIILAEAVTAGVDVNNPLEPAEVRLVKS